VSMKAESKGVARVGRALSLSEQGVYGMKDMSDSEAFLPSGLGGAGMWPSSFASGDQLRPSFTDLYEQQRVKGVSSSEMPGVTGAWGFVMDEEINDLVESWHEMVEAIEHGEWEDVFPEAESDEVMQQLEETPGHYNAIETSMVGCVVARLVEKQRCQPSVAISKFLLVAAHGPDAFERAVDGEEPPIIFCHHALAQAARPVAAAMLAQLEEVLPALEAAGGDDVAEMQVRALEGPRLWRGPWLGGQQASPQARCSGSVHHMALMKGMRYLPSWQRRAVALEAILGLADAMLGGQLWSSTPHPALTLAGKPKKRAAKEVGKLEAAAAAMVGARSCGPQEGEDEDDRSAKRVQLADDEIAKPPAKSD
jgi:hypothetical protein